MKNLYAEIQPIKPDGTFETIRLCSKGRSSKSTINNGHVWLPLVTEHPKFDWKATSNGVLDPVQISYGSISFSVSSVFDNEIWSTYDFTGAIASLWWGEDGDDFANYQQIYEGTTSALSREGTTASVNLLGSESQLQRPLLSSTYAGTGGAEGAASLKGVLKPWASGSLVNITPVLVDSVYWVYQVHGYGPVQDISDVYEFAQSLGAPAYTVSSYAELIALTLEPGQWAKANAVGMFRLGGQPSHKVTCDVQGAKDGSASPTSVSAIIQHLAKHVHSTIQFGDMSAFVGKSWCFYSTSQVQVGDICRQAAQEAGGWFFPDGLGIWQIGDLFAPKAPVTLSADRSNVPLVVSIKEAVTGGPTYKVSVGHTRNWTVLSDSEISPLLADLVGDQVQLQADLASAVSDLASAQSTLEVAVSRLDSMSADGVLDRAEKIYWIDEYSRLNAEKGAHLAEATSYGITTAKDAYAAAFTALGTYLATLSPAWNNTSADTAITREDFRAAWQGVYTAIVTLEQAVAYEASKRAIWGNVSGEGKPEDGATVGAPFGTTIGDVPVEDVLASLGGAGPANELSLALQQNIDRTTRDSIRGLIGLSNETDRIDELNFDRYTDVQSQIVTLSSSTAGSIAGLTTTLTTATSNIAALSAAQTDLTARLNSIGGSGQTMEAKFSALVTADATETSARTTAISNLTGRLNNIGGSGQSVETKISNLQTADATETAARTAWQTSMESRLNNVGTTGVTMEAKFTSLAGTISTVDSNRVAYQTALDARINNFQGVTGKTIEAKVNDVATAVTDEAGARASAINSVQSDYNGKFAAVTTTTNALSSRTGVVEAQYVLSVNSNGHVAGMKIANAGSGTSSIGFLADNFYVVNSAGSGTAPFQVVGGQTLIKSAAIGSATINSAMIQDLQIGTNKISLNAVTVVHNVSLGSAVSGTGYGNWYTPISYTLSAPVDCSLVFILSATQGFPSGDRRWEAHLKCDGSDVNAGGGYKTADTFSLGGQRAVSAGNHTISVDWSGDGGANLSTMNLVILETRR